MQYYAYELAHSLVSPARFAARATRNFLDLTVPPAVRGLGLKTYLAGLEVFEDMTRRYGKPEFGISSTNIHGLTVPIREEIVMQKTFCDLLHFDRDENVAGKRYDPKVLLVAPMSGHYATLLRGTVQAMVQEHNLYITDWRDAREVPLHLGQFDFHDFVDYIIEFLQFLGPNTHVVAVCQPSVPVLAAAAVMAANKDPARPASLTLMGGPIDTRRNPTVVNNLATDKPIEWFRDNVTSAVPFPNPGFMRRVYPGFMQLTGFMTMNLERHANAHMGLFESLVKGDHDTVAQHRRFYDEYLAVMDLTEEFYLQTVETVFQKHLLPDGLLRHRGELVDCRAITDTALLTIEGERDDICGLGQTEAAHDLCTSIPIDERYHYVQPGVGHYGVFNGTRWRTEIQPRVREMIRTIQFKRRVGPTGITVGLPYRNLRDQRDAQVDWRNPGNDGASKVVPATGAE